MRIANFDALRGAAILAVVQLHYMAITGGYEFLGLPLNAQAVLNYGWAGVDLFFVLSAYLLTNRLLQVSEKPHAILSFYQRRARRILPLYLVLLVVGLALAVVLPVNAATNWLFASSCPSWTYPLLVQNWCYGLAGGTDAHFFTPTWSLAVEEHFYIVLPLLARVGSARSRVIACLAIIVLSPVIRLAIGATAGPAAAYLWSVARADAFAWGILLATAPQVWPAFYKQVRPAWGFVAGVALLLATALVIPDHGGRHDYLFGITGTAFSAALLTYAAIAGAPSLGRLVRMLEWLGKRSYSLYLLHMPVLGLTFAGLGDHWPRVETSFDLSLIGLATLLSGAIACVTFHLFERSFVSEPRPRETIPIAAPIERVA